MNKKFVFTLSEGTPCIDPLQLVARSAFTLAEVLITLVVVGVVAAMTIPTLVANINEKVNTRQIEVAQKRLAESLRLYNAQESAFNGKTYESTYDFINNGLSKYFKMTSICDENHIGDCWPTGVINYEDNDGNIQTINASELKTPKKLNLDNDGYYAPASFISGAGVPYIMVLKKGCIIDPDSRAEDSDIWSCIDGLWDYQGTRQPNTLGKDVKAINSASINAGPKCLYSPNGVCMPIKPFYPSVAMANFAGANCKALKSGQEVTDTDGLFGAAGAKVKITNSFNQCPYTQDYWLAAKLKCESQGLRLPTYQELVNIAEVIYNRPKNSISIIPYVSTSGLLRGDITAYGLEPYTSNSNLALWSGAEHGMYDAGVRSFGEQQTMISYSYRNSSNIKALCVGE